MKSIDFKRFLMFFSVLITSNIIFGFSTKDGVSIIKADSILVRVVEKENSNLKAKATFDVGGVLTTSAATCINNGSVTAVANGGNGSPELYIFKITNGPTSNGQTYPTPNYYNASTYTFSALYPGIYEVTIEDANDLANPSFVQTIEVLDETENLDFSLDPTDPDCPNTSTGSLEVNISSGVGPYQYQIISGPTGTPTGLISGASTTYTFNSLPEGSYTIRVYDACGNFQSRSYILSDPSLAALNLYTSGSPNRERISCTDAIYKVGGSGGTGSGTYTYEVVGGAPSGYASSNTTGQFTLPINQAPYTIQVTDECGQTATYTHSNPNSYINWSSSQRTCSGWSLQINTNWMVGPFTFTLTNYPVGYSGPTSNSTGTFPNLPYGSYSFSATDSCGLTRFSSTTRTVEPVEINSLLTQPSLDYCTIGTGRVEIRYNNGSGGAVQPVTFELTTVPAGFTGDAGPQNGPTFDTLPPGNYVVTASDACGNVDTLPFEIADVLEIDLETKLNLSCVNSSSIDVDVTSNNSWYDSGTRRFRLYNATTSSLLQSGVVYSSSPSSYTFSNLSVGEYYVEFYKSSSCRFTSETISINVYEQPTLTPLYSYNCLGSGLVTISGVINGGAEPFTLSLINNANNQVVATSTDAYFEDQDPSLTYSVRIEDNCGNSTTSQVSNIPTGLGLVFQGDYCAETGTSFPLYLRRFRGVSYLWTFPDGTTYSGNNPRSLIGIVDNNDFGTYTVEASINNSCRTQTLTLDFSRCYPPAVDFDGVDDYLTGNSILDGLNQVTMMAWIKIDPANAGVTNNTIVGEDLSCRLYLQNGNTPIFGIRTTAGFTSATNGQSIDYNEWHHVTGVFDGVTGRQTIYIDGKKLTSSTRVDQIGQTILNTYAWTGDFEIGRYSRNTTNQQFFNGEIDEVRIFKTALTDDQVQRMVYQEIEDNNGHVRGTVIPKDIVDIATGNKILWSDLIAYYKMGPDFTAAAEVIDYSSNSNHLARHNITTAQEETAPMPYESSGNGTWTSEGTWLHGDVWDIEDVANNKDWSIVHIKDNVDASHEVKNIGLFIDTNKALTINSDNQEYNSWYFELNGTLDLEGDSQLIQTVNSDLVTSSLGKILRRQEGASNPYCYNYWSSPVGATGAHSLTDNNATSRNTNNSDFSLQMIKDNYGLNCQFTSGYTGSGNISTYWLYTYRNGKTYWDWASIGVTTPLEPGVGYTQKGTGTSAPEQQYIFEGKPNNGTILIDVADVGGSGSVADVSKTEYLLGNPYASAIDVHKFIDDNVGVIDGYLQLWQQWGGNSHNLNEYHGGYAQVNKTGSIRARQFVGISGETTGGLVGTIKPSRYLPVGQGFIIEIIAPNGKVEFNNSQRIFIKESDANGTDNSGSVFSKSAEGKSSEEDTTVVTEDENPMQKIRIELNSVEGPETKRELLLGFSEATTDGYDYGYDAKNTELSNNDLNLDLEGQNMNIQAYTSISDDKVIPLNFCSSGDNAFEISITELEHIEEDQAIYLRDNLTGTYFDLTQDTAYSFSSAQGVFNDRFEIVFQNEEQSLSTEASTFTENFMYYQKNTNTFFAKKLNSHVNKLSLVNMRGQVVLELDDVSSERLQNGIQFNTMSTGTYIVSLRTDSNEVLSKKIIVN